MRPLAKYILAVILVSVLPAPSSGYIMRKQVIRKAPAGGFAVFRLKNIAGSVNIQSCDSDTLSVTARFRIRAPSKSKAEEIFSETGFDFVEYPGKLYLEPDLPSLRQYGLFAIEGRARTSVAIDYEVTLPAGMDIEVEITGGDIILEKVKSSYKLSTERGEIDVERPGRVAGSVKTARGDITLRAWQCGWDGRFSAECGSGTINAFFRQSADLVFEASSLKGDISFLFEGIRPVIGDDNSIMAVFGKGRGRISLWSARGEINAEEINTD